MRLLAPITAAVLLVGTPSVAAAPTTVHTGTDDPATHVNESALLDTTRFEAVGERGPSSMDLARAYADTHGLTNCRAPEDAELDDVFLTRPVHPVDGQPYNDRITPVDLDTALDSAGKRIVLLACDKEKP